MLDKTRAASFASLWSADRLNYGWYRPWSRELHFWVLQRCFGADALPFHTTNLVLAFGVVIAYYTFARRLAGAGPAAMSAAGGVALAAFGVPVIWASGAQELWMLLFSLLALHAWACQRVGLSVAALLGALLSKETAAGLPLLVVAYGLAIERRSLPSAWVRSLPLFGVTALWAALHPLMGGRLWGPHVGAMNWGPPVPLPGIFSKTLLALFNLDRLPRPEIGWLFSLVDGLIPALVLIVLAASVARLGVARNTSAVTPHTVAGGALHGKEAAAGRIATFAGAWAVLGWLPLLTPGLSWQPYYTLFGALGAWLALGLVLARWSRVAMLFLAVLALLRPARAATPAFDWGSEWYHHRAAAFLATMQNSLKHLHPSVPPNSRLYFTEVPSLVGFLSGDAPALRVMYGDSTVRAAYLSGYRPRAAGEPHGSDYFFRFDTTRFGWVEIIEGEEDPMVARSANAQWERDHRALAAMLVGAREYSRAAVEWSKLADSSPDHVDYAFNVGTCAENLGDSVAAARWYQRAARLPAADDEVKRLARDFRHHLADSPP